MPDLDGQSLAAALVPQLHLACQGHLGKIAWFKADWQHGGAGTGFSTWTHTDRNGKPREIPCVVKLPIGYTEYFWTKRLGLVHPDEWDEPGPQTMPTPRVLAAGFELGGYDLAWVVMERFASLPIAMERSESAFWAMFEAAAKFQAAAVLEMPVEPEKAPPSPDWASLLEQGQAALRSNPIEHQSRWIEQLGRVQGCLGTLMSRWAARSIDTWCHHDLHPHNAMRRLTDDPDMHGHCALIDLALVAPGSWVEDALYTERLFWGREEQLCNIDPLTALASTRGAIGLPALDDEALELADVRRVLMAASAPTFLRTEGDPVYLKAALGVLERLLPGFIG